MIDRKKVVSALENKYDPEREYLHLVFIPNGLVHDALALLKEDDETIKHLRILLNMAHNSNHQKRDINLERGIMEDIRNG